MVCVPTELMKRLPLSAVPAAYGNLEALASEKLRVRKYDYASMKGDHWSLEHVIFIGDCVHAVTILRCYATKA